MHREIRDHQERQLHAIITGTYGPRWWHIVLMVFAALVIGCGSFAITYLMAHSGRTQHIDVIIEPAHVTLH